MGCERIFDAARLPDQLIVNEYTPGQGIAAHIDSALFASPIVSVSLGACCVMDFCRGAAKVAVALPPRSAVVLDGDARHRWSHAIAARTSDVIDGVRRERTHTRVSLTFRVAKT